VIETPVNRPGQVLLASLVGTTIEFFDFYIYATAAVIVFPRLFFPAPTRLRRPSRRWRPSASPSLPGRWDPRSSGILATVSAARPRCRGASDDGDLDGGHRLLPTYATIGFAAPLFLALCRFGQGLGLGGEWGGAVLLAIENAPPGRRAWYGMFPQLGAPLGFFLSGLVFLVLSEKLTNEEFFSYGWRIPFLASAVWCWSVSTSASRSLKRRSFEKR
jgi:MFS family permease